MNAITSKNFIEMCYKKGIQGNEIKVGYKRLPAISFTLKNHAEILCMCGEFGDTPAEIIINGNTFAYYANEDDMQRFISGCRTLKNGYLVK